MYIQKTRLSVGLMIFLGGVAFGHVGESVAGWREELDAFTNRLYDLTKRAGLIYDNEKEMLEQEERDEKAVEKRNKRNKLRDDFGEAYLWATKALDAEKKQLEELDRMMTGLQSEMKGLQSEMKGLQSKEATILYQTGSYKNPQKWYDLQKRIKYLQKRMQELEEKIVDFYNNTSIIKKRETFLKRQMIEHNADIVGWGWIHLLDWFPFVESAALTSRPEYDPMWVHENYCSDIGVQTLLNFKNWILNNEKSMTWHPDFRKNMQLIQLHDAKMVEKELFKKTLRSLDEIQEWRQELENASKNDSKSKENEGEQIEEEEKDQAHGVGIREIKWDDVD